MNKVLILLVVILGSVSVACNQKKGPERTDTTTSGVATVICDDCFSPILREEANVFQSMNGDATIKLRFANEVDALNLLFKDSVRLIVAARDLTPVEKKALQDKKMLPRSAKIAVDGIALIINKSNKDTLITVDEFRRILSGKIRTWGDLRPGSSRGTIDVIFDNANSSTVRYVQDSVSKGKFLSKNIYAKENNQAVLDYVSKTPNALGIIGVNWVSNPDDSTKLTFIDKIRVMSVSPYEVADADNSFAPVPAYLMLERYPFFRYIYMIITDAPGYLPSGFMNFVGGDRGQRIILKSGLVPSTRPMRLVNIHE
ncbi:MAG TPA: substrate-binding domain-containing protein [Bacteroidales bacterium]|nr:substrate-binding domain-containing protein [Bacteroidales bacterium]